MRRALAFGLAAVLALLLWQFLTVHYNYGGNWTALFCIAPHMRAPAYLASERLYIFQNSAGFDGQVYHLIAHDPWMLRRDFLAPAAFYHRILVPVLAWSLAFGQDSWIHEAYYTVVLAFVFLGVYWLSLFATRAGRHPAWGLAFVLTPATITSIDRMTVDVALAALTVAFAYCVDSRWKTIVILTCAALTKEQAIPLIGAYALYLITRKRFLDSTWVAATALPALVWSVYIARKQPAETLIAADVSVPLAGVVDAVVHPFRYSLTPFKDAAGVTFDYVALAGLAITFAFTIRFALQRRWSPRTSAIYALAMAASLLRNRLLWVDAYAFGRGLTPLMLLVALEDFGWLAFLPMLLVDARISLNLWSQVLGVIRGIL